MSSVLNFIWEWRYVGIVAIAFLLFGWQKVREIIYALMLQAKSKAKDMVLLSGQDQEDWVVKAAMTMTPVWMRAILNSIGETQIRKLIKWLYNKGKDYLDDGKLNDSI